MPGPPTIATLDAGLGTTLEALLGEQISTDPLWSTQAVIHHPIKLVETHLCFLDAGARIIETATYQASIPSLIKSGIPEVEASNVMLTAVRLARKARDIFANQSDNAASIALSLGPFGATLRPTQEFDGFYPPPYGPKAYDENGSNIRDFDSSKDQVSAVDALAQFHLERLLVYSSAPDVWDAIDYLAFETVLLPREVTAIREAMRRLQYHLSAQHRQFNKSWWISFVCPSVSNAGMEALVASALKARDGPVPSGLGINCTAIDNVLPLTAVLSREAAKLLPLSELYLALYPNGGTYDIANQCWLPLPIDANRQWATKFYQILSEVSSFTNGWKNIIAGGCCRTNPSYIQQLSNELCKQ